MKIFHYTSDAGLLGIIQSESLWVTHFKYLNDISELHHAKEIIENIVENSEEKLVKKYKEVVMVCLKQIYEIYDVYTCSFSKKPDQLSQWRAYCPNNGGFSIGFEIQDLKNSNSGVFLECLYDSDEQNKIAKQLIIQFCKNCEKLVKDEKISFPEKWNKRFQKMNIESYEPSKSKNPLDLEKNHIFIRYELALLAARIKNKNFEEENEIRYIQVLSNSNHSKINYRTKNNLIIPHVLLKVKKENIKEINIGPSLDQVLNNYSLKSLKMKHRLNFEINNSPIPYRGW